jgi:transposase
MFYLGIDVAKAKLDCCLLLDHDSMKRKSKSVANTKAGFATLLEWLIRKGVSLPQLHAVMEGTGVYHEQAALALVDAGVTVSIINPAQIRDFGRGLGVRTKTDGVDSFVLARYGALLKPAAWQPPAPETCVLRALLARREAIAQDLQRELNRLEKADATETCALIRQSIDDSIDFLRKQLAKLQQDIDHHIDRHPDLRRDMELLTSIPAGGPGRLEPICWQSSAAIVSIRRNNLPPILAWFRLNGNPDRPFWEEPDSQKPVLPESGPYCTWRLL